jgi:Fe-S-cluster containining protein
MNKGTQGCMYNCGDSCTGECMKPIDVVMNKEEAKDELIKVLYSQMADLLIMSKIELGDDVIEEIRRLSSIINQTETK